jgi:hypothetical protein
MKRILILVTISLFLCSTASAGQGGGGESTKTGSSNEKETAKKKKSGTKAANTAPPTKPPAPPAPVAEPVSAHEPDDEVRGAFLSTRPKTTNANAPSGRHKRRTTSGTSAIGLGYTLFMRDENGRAVRVDPTREFHNGDRVRISLEPNIDGYLYVFHTANDGAPEMIYPDPRLDAGDNTIEAHVLSKVPSSGRTDEPMRWFTFYGNAATERLYIVLTREPLPFVPMSDALVGFCATNKDKCPWHPSTEVWTQMKEAMKAGAKVVAAQTFGQPQTAKEETAPTRGLGLDQSAPPPSVIRMNASTSAPILVTVLDLVHK